VLILVSGGAASGKSEYAEQLAVQQAADYFIYLATMEVWDEESRGRVERHRLLRQGKGFTTLEVPRALETVQIPSGSCVLLECLSNLTANELFGPKGMDEAFDRITDGLSHLMSQVSSLVVVSNELFSDGITYAPETEAYLAVLAQLNRWLAERADYVYEVVCGIPICWKGEKP
jgi:adenosylcobinamide kinase/adenosylcobinamide-phosphate guanylyltransferase